MSRLRGDVAARHARDLDWSRRSVTICEATGPAVVLGSTQPRSHVLARADLDVVRRRSGGGAVLVGPAGPLWVEVVVPAGDPLWEADVGRAFWWLGEAWAAALADLGSEGAVHRGGLVVSRWSPMVCFAGLGPGEVSVGGRKVVGMAQRRVRQGTLLQCAADLGWDPAPLLDVLALDAEERRAAVADLGAAAGAVAGVTATDLEAALVARLP